MVKCFPRRQLGDALGVRMGCTYKNKMFNLSEIKKLLLSGVSFIKSEIIT